MQQRPSAYTISDSFRAGVETIADTLSVYTIPGSPRGGYFQVKDYWGCAAGWGHIFTTGLTIMGLHFQLSY